MNREIEKIKVKTENGELYIEKYQKQNLLEILQNNHVYVSNTCHGNGTCGKCKIKLLSGNLPITEADRRTLSKKELESGIRLACKAVSGKEGGATEEDTLSIEVVGQSEEEIVIEGASFKKEKEEICRTNILDKVKADETSEHKITAKENYFIAIDIGTTTIAMVLADADTGNICSIYTSLNHQRKFGADVISRIAAANDGKSEELKQLAEEDLWKGIYNLIIKHKENEIQISGIFISGNTTMIHLLMGYSCQSLGKYPFVSEHLEQIECTLKDCISLKANPFVWNNCLVDNPEKLYKIYENVPVLILPGISAFIGGDIAAGILTCSGFETEEICLLIDLGTNGEMVLGNKNKLLAASAAAGPAFEGGNITCGAASIPGSISKIKIQNQRAIVKTINETIPPVGICGTGLVSTIAQLKLTKLMNRQGELRYPYNEKGYPLWNFENGEKIALYQQDIREFQMAKSAIRAGIEVLMQEYGCTVKEISHVYLAGGFGVNLSEDDAICTGILPEEFSGKTESIGNSALQGTIQVGRSEIEHAVLKKTNQVDEKQKNRKMIDMKGIMERIKNVSLAESKNFQKYYLQFLEF